jgi:hypothetical protein
MSWRAMMKRCFSRTHCKFNRYGGQGITVCRRWMDFRNFLADMGERPSKNHTIDRINNGWIYEPRNCRWATLSEQRLNTFPSWIDQSAS